ncbi:ribonuclease H-like domain-containing protein, partial [Mycena floridula]
YSWKTQTNGAVQTYTRDIDKANESIQAAYDQGETAFGFDVEWKPSFRKGEAEHPVALVQLATNNRILLIQISAMSAVPEKLVALLTDPNIVKAGVGIQGDIKKIHKDLNICTRSCVDLSLLARTVDNARWKGPYKNPIGLARLTEVYENKALGKGLITRSNWELDLSPEQIEYASNDAHAGFALYTRLSALLSPDNPGHKRKYYSFDLIRGRLYEPSSGDSAVKEWRCHNPEYDPGPPP